MLDNKFLLVRGYVAALGTTVDRAGDFGYFNQNMELVPFGAIGVFSNKHAAQNRAVVLGGVWSLLQVNQNTISVLSCKTF